MNTAIRNLKIYLVDDDPFFIGILEGYLNGLGVQNIQTFTQSPDCLHQLYASPDLIFLDYNMDNLNGIETLKKIKRENPNQLVVFISGQHKINVAVDALKYGAFDYVIKDDINENKVESLLTKVNQFKLILKSKSKGPLKNIIQSLGLTS